MADLTKGKYHSSWRSPTRKGKLLTWVKSFWVSKVQYTVGEAVKYIELQLCSTSLSHSWVGMVGVFGVVVIIGMVWVVRVVGEAGLNG